MAFFQQRFPRHHQLPPVAVSRNYRCDHGWLFMTKRGDSGGRNGGLFSLHPLEASATIMTRTNKLLGCSLVTRTNRLVGCSHLLSLPPSRSNSVSTLQALRLQVESGTLQPDPAQERLAKRLARLEEALVEYDNSILLPLFQQQSENNNHDDDGGNNKVESIDTSDPIVAMNAVESKNNQTNDENIDTTGAVTKTEPPPPPNIKMPRGLYIYGPVGTGKSMLMDSFYDNVTLAQPSRKKRIHFHNFLSQVHKTIHQLKQQDLQKEGRNVTIDTSLVNNPVHRVGLQLASELSLLCLDEFQVTDIADAVILSQLFSVLFQNGTVVVATSNRPPQDLYEGGLNRGYYILPFIELLERHCFIYKIPSQRDYRRLLASCSSFFVSPARIDAMVTDLVEKLKDSDVSENTDNNEPCSVDLLVGFQRTITVKRVYGTAQEDGRYVERIVEQNQPSMACFYFDELCDNDLGAMDYRAIAQAFHIVVLQDIPTLSLEGHNRSRRFITLIDELYEAKCALLCSALEAETPMDLFRNSQQKDETNYYNTNDDNESEILWVDVAQQGGTPVGALASVRELSFAFDRASSRIYEMCSRSWWDRVLKNSSE